MGEPSTAGESRDVLPLVGRRLGDFVVQKLIGEGGYGQVYLAFQPLLERQAVVKVLHHRHGTSEVVIQRFLREARLASRIDHPYAAHIYAFGAEADGLLWIAMELVRGVPLSQLIAEQGPVPLERFATFLECLCEVVQTVHEQGIVHSDLKPANIMVLSRAGRLLPKLLDLGIARDLDSLEARQSAMLEAGAGQAGSEDGLAETDGHNGDASIPEPLAKNTSAVPSLSTAKSTSGPMSAQIARVGVRTIQGSPHYMAPEQWYDPGKVDARTDIYAVGVLCFEALTGAPPFMGKTTTAIARGHAKRRVPPLGGDFPFELNTVIAKAMAKRQEQRFSTAIELSAAFSKAAGVGSDEPRLPELEPSLCEEWMAGAPQPLAEAIAMLEGARNAHQAGETLREVIELTAHHVGLIAVASWVRAARGKPPTAKASELARALVRHGLTARQWARMARELVRPFADKSDLHPVPELVQLFFPDGWQPGGEDEAEEQAQESDSSHESSQDPWMESWNDVSEVSSVESPPPPGFETSRVGRLERRGRPFVSSFAVLTSKPGIDASDDEMRDFLARALGELARHLRQLSFLLHYPIVVPGDGLAERWMGVRRARRPAFELSSSAGLIRSEHSHHSAVAPGQPLMVDAAGVPVISLHPLIQVETPVPGGQRELFLLDGPSRRGARLVARPRGFEHRDPGLWKWLRNRFLADIVEDASDSAGERAPYQGLSTFTTADADLYFGRETEAEKFANRMQVQSLLAVVGPSGAGKSSFIQAGVVPLLSKEWRVVTMRPGATPTATLIARIDHSGLSVDWAEPNDANDIAKAISRAVESRQERLLLVVDQFEELFTLCQDLDERVELAEILAQLTASIESPVRVVITLRDDFLMRAQSLALLRKRLTHSLQLLATPDRDDLLRILTAPAERVGYRFEDPRLPEQMVDEVGEHPSALALLSFAAAQLWELRDRQSKQLRRVAYETMGGVGGALAHHADATLAAMSADELLVVREAFRHLVTAQGTRAVLTRTELEQLLGSGPHSEQVVESLIGARLLVAREGEEGAEQIEITHEALISDWPQLAKWRREDAEGARLRDELRAAARQWDERARPSWLLWRGEALTEYQLWRARYPGSLTRVEEDFAASSRRQEARGRQLRRAALIGAFIMLSAGMIIALWLNNRATEERDRAAASEVMATQRLVDLRVEQARQAFVHEEPLHGMAFLHDAIDRGADGPMTRYLLSVGARVLASEKLSLRAGSTVVEHAYFIGDGERIITAALGSTAKVWSAETGELLFEYPGVSDKLALGPGDEVVAIGGSDGSVRLFETDGPRLLQELEAPLEGSPQRRRVHCIEISQDGRYVIAGRADRTVKIWSARTGKEVVKLPEQSEAVLSCGFNPDASRAVIAGGPPRVWNTRTGQVVHQLEQGGRRQRVVFSPDGRQIVTHNSSDPVARIWDSSTGEQLMALQTHGLGVSGARYSDDGKSLVTATQNGAAQLWDATTGTRQLVVSGHDGLVLSAALGPKKERLVTAGTDGSVILWDVKRGDRLVTIKGHLAKVRLATFDANGSRLITASEDGTAKVWSTAPRALQTQLLVGDNHDDHIVSSIFGLEDDHIVTYSRNRAVRLWDRQSGKLLATYDADKRPVTRDMLIYLSDSRAIPAFHPRAGAVAAPLGKIVRFLDPRTLEPMKVLQGHDDRVTSVTFTPDGRFAVTTSLDTTARIWSVETGEQLRALEGSEEPLVASVVSADGKRVATVGYETVARVWDFESGRLLSTLEGHTAAVMAASFSPDGRRLATVGTDSTLRIWDLDTGNTRVVVDTVVATFGAAYSPDGQVVAIIDGLGRVSIWDAERGLLLDKLGSASSFGYWIAFDTRGDRFAIATGGAQVWDIHRDPRPPAQVLPELESKLPYVLSGERIVLRRDLLQPESQ